MPPSQSIHRRQTWWWMVAALMPLAAVVAMSWGDPPASSDGDYAQYLLHAKALAEGRPYSDIGYIYTDMNLVGPRNQPPGWPVVLAPLVAAFGVHSPAIRLLVVALLCGFAITAGFFATRRYGAAGGVLVASCVPLALETERATGSALSDPLFCLLVWAVLLLVDSPGSPRRAIAAVLLAGAALSVRVAGVGLVGALVLHVILRRRHTTWRTMGPVVALVAVAGVLGVLAADHVPFLQRFLRELPGLSSIDLAFALTYKNALSSATLYPFASDLANDGYHVLVGIPLAVGIVRYAYLRAGSIDWCFTLVYTLLLLASPVREPRYAWPLTPVILMCLIEGVSWLGSRFVPAATRPTLSRLAGAGMAVVVVLAGLQLARRPAPHSLMKDPDAQALFTWVRDQQERLGITMRILFPNPRVLTLETGASAMGVPFGVETDVLQELSAHRISHVVLPAVFSRESERRLAAVMNTSPERFPRVYQNASYDVRRFLIVRDSAGGGLPPASFPAQ